MIRLAMAVLLAALIGVPSTASAADAGTIDRRVQEALGRLYAAYPSLRPIVQQARAVLVFPRVYKAGIGIGGDYGEGAMLEGGRTSGYYNIVAGSVGFQLGAQRRSQFYVFTDADALARFKNTDGWKVGVDGSVVLVTLGASGNVDTNSIRAPVFAVVMGEKGLMYNATLEGSKISRIDP
ncbi:MAG TPA: hypothetical protein DDZ76_09760 [Xanthomonadales bacterium]|nr:hypothetical protein [Xanthomonadales bacterium]